MAESFWINHEGLCEEMEQFLELIRLLEFISINRGFELVGVKRLISYGEKNLGGGCHERLGLGQLLNVALLPKICGCRHEATVDSVWKVRSEEPCFLGVAKRNRSHISLLLVLCLEVVCAVGSAPS